MTEASKSTMTKLYVPATCSALLVFFGLLLFCPFAGSTPIPEPQPASRLAPISWLVGKWTAVEQGAIGVAVTIQLDARRC